MDRAIVDRAVRALAAVNAARGTEARHLTAPAIAPLPVTRPTPPQGEREAESWHCGGSKVCPCSTCRAGGPDECVACRGTGKVRAWLQ